MVDWGVIIGVVLELTTGSAETAFDKSFGLAIYGGCVGVAVKGFSYVRSNWRRLIGEVFSIVAFVAFWVSILSFCSQ
jgi:hypothetical protein